MKLNYKDFTLKVELQGQSVSSSVLDYPLTQSFNVLVHQRNTTNSQFFEYSQIQEKIGHVLCVILRYDILDYVLQQPEGLLLIVGGEQQETGDIIEALAVAHLAIVMSVGHQNIVQARLLALEIDIVGKGSWQIDDNAIFYGLVMIGIQ